MKEFPPNINSELFTLTAIIVGLIIEDDYTSDELNSIGNWLILVGQITLTTSAQQQLINNRSKGNTGYRIKSGLDSQDSFGRVSFQTNFSHIYQEIYNLKNEIEKIKRDK